MGSKGTSVFNQSIYRGSGSVHVRVEPEDLVAFLQENKEIRDLLIGEAQKVQDEAAATAQDAQGGPGGRLYDYAESGFSVEWEQRSRRPRVNIRSNADPEMALRVHISTTVRNGIGHLRAALKSIC